VGATGAEVQAASVAPSRLQRMAGRHRARYPQSFRSTIHVRFHDWPKGVGMDNGALDVQASQKIPWAGKRALRGRRGLGRLPMR